MEMKEIKQTLRMVLSHLETILDRLPDANEKPEPEPEPKFKVGDVVMHNTYLWVIKEVHNHLVIIPIGGDKEHKVRSVDCRHATPDDMKRAGFVKETGYSPKQNAEHFVLRDRTWWYRLDDKPDINRQRREATISKEYVRNNIPDCDDARRLMERAFKEIFGERDRITVYEALGWAYSVPDGFSHGIRRWLFEQDFIGFPQTNEGPTGKSA